MTVFFYKIVYAIPGILPKYFASREAAVADVHKDVEYFGQKLHPLILVYSTESETRNTNSQAMKQIEAIDLYGALEMECKSLARLRNIH